MLAANDTHHGFGISAQKEPQNPLKEPRLLLEEPVRAQFI